MKLVVSLSATARSFQGAANIGSTPTGFHNEKRTACIRSAVPFRALAKASYQLLDRLSRGHQLVYYKRGFEELAQRCDRFGLPALARYYRLVDSKTKSYFYEGGEKRVLKGAKAERETAAQPEQAQAPVANRDSVSGSSHIASSSRCNRSPMASGIQSLRGRPRRVDSTTPTITADATTKP